MTATKPPRSLATTTIDLKLPHLTEDLNREAMAELLLQVMDREAMVETLLQVMDRDHRKTIVRQEPRLDLTLSQEASIALRTLGITRFPIHEGEGRKVLALYALKASLMQVSPMKTRLRRSLATTTIDPLMMLRLTEGLNREAMAETHLQVRDHHKTIKREGGRLDLLTRRWEALSALQTLRII
jgi:hypothetical protein